MAAEETVRRVEAALGFGQLTPETMHGERGHHRTQRIAKALEAAAKCGGCDGLGVLRLPDGDVPCPGGADGARCENGLDPARLAAAFKELEK